MSDTKQFVILYLLLIMITLLGTVGVGINESEKVTSPSLFDQSISQNYLGNFPLPNSQKIGGSIGLTNLAPKTEPFSSDFFVWEEQELLENNSGFILDLDVAVDDAQNVHCFWVQQKGGTWQLFHRIKFHTNNSWSSPEPLETISDVENGQVDVVSDQQGQLHLVWDSNNWIYYRRHSKGSWSPREMLFQGNNPKIKVKGNETRGISFTKFHSTWSQYYLAEFISENSTWDVIQFESAYDAENFAYDFCINQNKQTPQYFIVTSETGHSWTPETGRLYYLIFRLFCKEKNGLTGSTFKKYSITRYGSYSSFPPSILCDSSGTLHLFLDRLVDDEHQLFYQKRTSNGWQAPVLLSPASEQDVYAIDKSVAIDKYDGLTVVWSEREYNTSRYGQLRLKTHKPGIGWSKRTLLQPTLTLSRSPAMTLDHEGNAHLLWWEDFADQRAVYYRFGWGDADGDGLLNKEEWEQYGTDPHNADSDEDEFLDGEEIALGFDPLDPDEDGDQMVDGWEAHHGLDPRDQDGSGDKDGDDLSNYEEFLAGTLPDNPDTDADGVSDYLEVKVHGSDPCSQDTDGDGVADGTEILELQSDPLDVDTDGDTMDDRYEYIWGLKVLENDTLEDPDGDGLINLLEYQHNTRPDKADHDGDGLTDYEEVMVYGSDPIAFDTDLDGLEDGDEVLVYGTDPTKKDTDEDQLTDKQELQAGTNATCPDTDSDGMSDGYEWIFGLDPRNASDAFLDEDQDGLTNYNESQYWTDPHERDTDGDNLFDGEEITFGSDPAQADTDGDGLDDFTEFFGSETNPLDADTDGDGLTDYQEYRLYHSDPTLVDTDQDGLSDGDEVLLYGCDPTTEHSDADQLPDQEEVLFGSNPERRDTDNDGMDDYWEWLYDLDPQVDDTEEDLDQDGLTNGEEYQAFTNPRSSDTDNDGLSDADELYTYYTLPHTADSDQDALSDSEELFVYETSPRDPDSDDDGLQDGREVTIGTDPKQTDTDHDGFPDGQELVDQTDPLDPQDNQRAYRQKVVGAVLGGTSLFLLLYYLVPYLFNRLTSPAELQWTDKKAEDKRSAEELVAGLEEVKE
ncbi:MAG: hypothetical protein GF308_22160 [Candidatus Heimdallarchaeota archaeon]|nr:hypothetical protein [Candidatus Heimdallarchaeota archaeon]